MGLNPPEAIVTALQDLGFNWPEADEERLFDLAGAWFDFHPQLDPLLARLESAAAGVWTGNSGDAVDEFRRKWTDEQGVLSSLQDSVAGAQMVAPLVIIAAAVVLALKINVIVQIVLFLIEVIQALAEAIPSGGASTAMIPIYKELTSRVVNVLIALAMEAILG